MDCETVQHLVEVFNLFNYPWNVIYWTIPVLSLMDIARNAEAVKFQIRSVYTHSPALRIGSSVYMHSRALQTGGAYVHSPKGLRYSDNITNNYCYIL